MGEAGHTGDGWGRDDEPEAFVRLCPQCGQEVPKSSVACPSCATSEASMPSTVPAPPPEPLTPPAVIEPPVEQTTSEPSEAPARRWWWGLTAAMVVMVVVAAVTLQGHGDDATAGDEWLPEVPTEANELFEIELTPGERPRSIVGSRDRVIVLAGPSGEAQPRTVSVYDRDGSIEHQFDVPMEVAGLNLVDKYLLAWSSDFEVWVYDLGGVERWAREGSTVAWSDDDVVLMSESDVGGVPDPDGSRNSITLQRVDPSDGTIVDEFETLRTFTWLGSGEFHIAIEGDDVHVRNVQLETVATWRDADLGVESPPALAFDGERLYTAVGNVVTVHDGEDTIETELDNPGEVHLMSSPAVGFIVTQQSGAEGLRASGYRANASGRLQEVWSDDVNGAWAYGGFVQTYGSDARLMWPDGEPVDNPGTPQSLEVVGPTTVRSDEGVSHYDPETRDLVWRIESNSLSHVVVIDKAVVTWDDTASPPTLQVYGED